MRELALAAACVISAACIVVGTALLSVPVAWIVAGVAVGGIAYLFLVEAG